MSPTRSSHTSSRGFDPIRRADRSNQRTSSSDVDLPVIHSQTPSIPGEQSQIPYERPAGISTKVPRRLPTLRDLKCLKSIGAGAYGRVMLARNTQAEDGPWDNPGRLVALKSLNKRELRRSEADTNGEKTDKFFERAHLATLPWNPFICGILGAFHDIKNYYIAMELTSHGTLLDLSDDKPMSDRDASFYFSNIVCGIEFLHSHGIVHRDIKPENILLCGDGYLCLADFGNSKYESDSRTQWHVEGTYEYVAPEIFNGAKDVPWCATDWWSAGVILYLLLTGTLPFLGRTEIRTSRRVKTGKYAWPENLKIASSAKHLVSCLLDVDWRTRIDGLDVQEHRWLQNVKWEKMNGREYLAPFVPKAKNLELLYHKKPLPEQRDVPGLDIVEPQLAGLQSDGRHKTRGCPWFCCNGQEDLDTAGLACLDDGSSQQQTPPPLP